MYRSAINPVRRNGSVPLPGVPGVYLSRAEHVLNPSLVAFLKELRRRLPFDITVNSGIRTAERQGKAMWDNANKWGGLDYIAGQYGSKVVKAGLYSVRSAQDMIDLVQRMASQGILISDHMSGRALDFAVPSSEQKQVLIQTLRGMTDLAPDIDVIDERDHFHVEGIPLNLAEKMVDIAKVTAKKTLRIAPYVWLTFGAGFLLLAAARVYQKRRK